jgi:hypothetical protein
MPISLPKIYYFFITLPLIFISLLMILIFTEYDTISSFFNTPLSDSSRVDNEKQIKKINSTLVPLIQDKRIERFQNTTTKDGKNYKSIKWSKGNYSTNTADLDAEEKTMLASNDLNQDLESKILYDKIVNIDPALDDISVTFRSSNNNEIISIIMTHPVGFNNINTVRYSYIYDLKIEGQKNGCDMTAYKDIIKRSNNWCFIKSDVI